VVAALQVIVSEVVQEILPASERTPLITPPAPARPPAGAGPEDP